MSPHTLILFVKLDMVLVLLDPHLNDKTNLTDLTAFHRQW